jgi:hypothetical protein
MLFAYASGRDARAPAANPPVKVSDLIEPRLSSDKRFLETSDWRDGIQSRDREGADGSVAARLRSRL